MTPVLSVLLTVQLSQLPYIFANFLNKRLGRNDIGNTHTQSTSQKQSRKVAARAWGWAGEGGAGWYKGPNFQL